MNSVKIIIKFTELIETKNSWLGLLNCKITLVFLLMILCLLPFSSLFFLYFSVTNNCKTLVRNSHLEVFLIFLHESTEKHRCSSLFLIKFCVFEMQLLRRLVTKIRREHICIRRK